MLVAGPQVQQIRTQDSNRYIITLRITQYLSEIQIMGHPVFFLLTMAVLLIKHNSFNRTVWWVVLRGGRFRDSYIKNKNAKAFDQRKAYKLTRWYGEKTQSVRGHHYRTFPFWFYRMEVRSEGSWVWTNGIQSSFGGKPTTRTGHADGNLMRE